MSQVENVEKATNSMKFRKPSLLLVVPLTVLVAACVTVPREPQELEKISNPVPTVEGGSVANLESADPNGYTLAQGDLIGIQVFDEPDLTLDARVSSSGNINYSYLGDVRVSGKTPLELEQHIAGLLRNGYLVNPSVNVSIIEYRPFFIGGEVRSPGSYPFLPGLTLDKAIALAGGLTDRASTRRMFVVRSGGSSSNPEKITLGAPVSPGDTVTIKEGFF